MSGVTEHAPVAGSAGGSSLPGLIAPSSRSPAARFITDVVLELGLASEEDVQAAVDAARAAGGRAEDVLVRTGVLDEDDLAVALAERFGLDRVDLPAFAVDGAAAERVTVETGLRYDALPVAVLPGGRLLVAVADPAGPGVAAVGAATGAEVVAAVAPRGALRRAIEAAASRVAVAPPVVAPAMAEPVDAPSSAISAAAAVDDARVAGLER